MTQVIGYSEKLDEQNRAIVVKCTSDGLAWGYKTQDGHRISDSQFDITFIPEDVTWTDFAEDWLHNMHRCYQVVLKED